MKRLKLIIGLLLVLNSTLRAQCPIAGFSIPDSVCPGIPVPINNSSSTASSWNWDYCLGDLEFVPTSTTVSGGGSLNYPGYMKVVEENGNYFGFVPNNGANYITRYDFGNSPSNTPSVVSLTPDPLLAGFAYSIDLVKENNKWIGFTALLTGGKIIRMEFDSITQLSPILTDLGSNNLFGPYVIKIIGDYMFVTNQLTDVSRFTFNGSYLNTPVAILPTIQSNYFNNSGLDIAYDCSIDKYIGFVNAYSNDLILKLDFGNDLNNIPTVTTSYNIVKPQGIQIVKEGNSWNVFTVTETNKLFHFKLGTSLDNPLAYHYDDNLGGAFNEPKSIQLIKKGSDWIGLVPNRLLFALSRLTFPQGSALTPNNSTDQSPNNLNYPTGSTGIQYLELTETDVNGNTTFYFDSTLTTILPPTAAFSYSAACENTNTQFLDLSSICSGNLIGWKWDFGDATGSTQQNPSHIYATNGNYNVMLTVYTTNGDSSIVQQSVTVFSNPIASFAFTDSVCNGTPVFFTDNSTTATGSISSWNWMFGDTQSDNTANPIHMYNSDGIFQSSLIVTATNGCIDTVSQTVTILPSPTSGYTIANSCLGELAQFVSTSFIGSGTITNFNWDFGDASSSNLQNPTHDFGINPGNFTVTLICEANNGCSDTIAQTIRIGNRPQPWFLLNTDTACAGNNITCTDSSIIASGDTITARYWDFGDSTIDSTSLNPTHSYQNPGTYTITLTVVSPTSCDSTISRTIFVIESPEANFTTTNVCLGLGSSFQDLSTSPIGSTIVNWNWNFGDTTSSGLSNPVHNYLYAGDFTVTLEVTSSQGCFDTISYITKIYDIPNVAFSNSKPCTGTPIQFTDSSTVNGSSVSNWEWNFGIPGGTSSLQNPIFTFTNPLAYPISLIATSIEGCSDTLTRYMVVDQSPQFTIQASNNCLGLPTTFLYQPIGTPGNISPAWFFGDSTASNLTNPIHIYSSAGIFPVTLTVTDLTNGCSSIQYDSAEISPKPTSIISVNSACVNLPIQFTDLSVGNGGTINQWLWTLGTHGNSLLQNPNLTLSTADSFQVKLVVTSDKGCKDSTSAIAQAYALPLVKFTATPFFGAPPMNVSYLNQSEPANYLWDFGDGSPLSTAFQPQHLFIDTGTFYTQLIATNNYGCIDSANKEIIVLLPNEDLGITSLNFTAVNGLWQITATLRNYGNITVENFSLIARLDGKSIINESFTESIPSGYLNIVQFKSSFYVDNNENPGFLCIDIANVNDKEDSNTENNHRCITTSTEFEILDVYPNPFNDILNLGINSPDEQMVTINIYDVEGRIVLPALNSTLLKGYNNVTLKTEKLSGGIYTIEVRYGENLIHSKVMRQ